MNLESMQNDESERYYIKMAHRETRYAMTPSWMISIASGQGNESTAAGENSKTEQWLIN